MAKPVKYEKAYFMDLDEALGIDEEEIQKKQFNRLMNLDVHALAKMHREDTELLKESDTKIDHSLVEYEKDDNDLEPVENAFANRIDILYRMARRFHPLSKYGKGMLKNASSCRKEYEKLIVPMASRITAKNVELFKTVLPPDLMEDIACGRRSAIGAIRSEKHKLYGVGVVAFYTDKVSTYDKGVLFIDWLYVDPNFRRKGISHFLIGELMAFMADLGIENVAATFPAKNSYNYLIGYILGSWSFEFGTGLNMDVVIKMGDIKHHNKIDAYQKGSIPLSKLDDAACKKLIRSSFKKYKYSGFLSEVPKDYIDRELSFYIGSPDDASAILLAHRTPSGIMRVEFTGVIPGQEVALGRLVCAFLKQAYLNSDNEDIVTIPIVMEEMGEFLEKICPNQMGQYLVEGDLEPPQPDFDMDDKEVNDLIKP